MILGTVKFEDIPPLPVEDIKSFKKGMADLLSQGHPVDLPIGMPFYDVARMSATLTMYVNLAEKLASIGAENAGETPDLLALIDEAQALVDAKPTPPPKSRVILPR